MAASWDPAVAQEAQAVAAREARAVGIHWTFAPNVDMGETPRWGRTVEGAGEDPTWDPPGRGPGPGLPGPTSAPWAA